MPTSCVLASTTGNQLAYARDPICRQMHRRGARTTRCTIAICKALAINEIERVLGISRRQVQRELRKALDALSALLWQRRCGGLPRPKPRRQRLDRPHNHRHAASSEPSRPREQHLLLDQARPTARADRAGGA